MPKPEIKSTVIYLRTVKWSSYRYLSSSNYGHDERPTRLHLTADEGYAGKTLCGKKFAADKGNPAPSFQFCKGCIRKAYQKGFEKGFTKHVTSSVPSFEKDY